jgi:hypothetical protein
MELGVAERERVINNVVIMKNLSILFAVLVGGTGCSTVSIQTDQAKDADFSSYSTFGFYEIKDEDTDPIYFSQINQERFVEAIGNELSARGYAPSDSPDLKVAFFLKVLDRQRVINNPSYFGGPSYYGHYYGYNRRWLNVSQVVDYKKGTFVLDLVDATANRLVWQGIIEGEFFESESITGRDIDEGIAELFKKLPK